VERFSFEQSGIYNHFFFCMASTEIFKYERTIVCKRITRYQIGGQIKEGWRPIGL
jgi:hypothetical protein